MIYPIGIQDFESLRKDGYVYVDKTEHVYQLVATGRYYFLSRPRRFGKSMLLSTLEAYFSGKKELFEGLAIERLEKDWVKYPILHLDLNTEKYDSKESLYHVLDDTLAKWEMLYGKSPTEATFALRFKGIVERAAEKTGQRVVILIDEYDKPMLQAIGNDELQREYRSTLKAFYSVLKTQDRYIKFALLTGVTKFGKVSVFSDLNNLKDISMDLRYIDICGITEKELHTVFDDSIQQLADANNLSKEECYAQVKRKFDGYHFEEGTQGIYNPFSVLNTLAECRFRDYWFETGTPTFLVELLKKTDYPLEDLLTEEVSSDILNSIEMMDTNPVPVIYQSGYLTIKGYDKEFGMYRLGFPNEEVEKGFINYLLPFYTPLQKNKGDFFVKNLVRDLRKGNVEGFMERFEAMFADGDYRVVGDMELYFQNCMFVITKMLGFYTEVERVTSHGRIDLNIQTPDYIYIMELKLDGSADEALAQIERKQYAAPFASDQRQLFKIGISFSTQTRKIEDWKMA